MIIELLDGTRYDIEYYSLKRLYHRIPSLTVEHSTASVEGRDGDIFLTTRFASRTIKVDFIYLARDIYDYYLLRDELNGLFTSKEAFYIIFKREPYKRWKVRLAHQLETEPSRKMRPFTVDFVCDNLFAESVGTSLDLAKRDFDSGLWGWGSGINLDVDYQYVFSEKYFSIHNIGNVVIDPCEHELEIVLKGDFAEGVTIYNQTTDELYRYLEPLTASDTLALKGIQTYKNGVSDFKNTNKKLISLAVGENVFSILGGTPTSIAFIFRFLYK